MAPPQDWGAGGQLSAEAVIVLLGLEPLPLEGGFFRQVYRSPVRLAPEHLPGRYPGPRPLATAIYYLLTPAEFSALHRLRSDELYHFYLGDPVELVQLGADGLGRVDRLGIDLPGGERPQLGVPAGTWQGARLASGGRFALLGTTVFPGYDDADFELGDRSGLLAAYPAHRDHIRALTRGPG